MLKCAKIYLLKKLKNCSQNTVENLSSVLYMSIPIIKQLVSFYALFPGEIKENFLENFQNLISTLLKNQFNSDPNFQLLTEVANVYIKFADYLTPDVIRNPSFFDNVLNILASIGTIDFSKEFSMQFIYSILVFIKKVMYRAENYESVPDLRENLQVYSVKIFKSLCHVSNFLTHPDFLVNPNIFSKASELTGVCLFILELSFSDFKKRGLADENFGLLLHVFYCYSALDIDDISDFEDQNLLNYFMAAFFREENDQSARQNAGSILKKICHHDTAKFKATLSFLFNRIRDSDERHFEAVIFLLSQVVKSSLDDESGETTNVLKNFLIGLLNDFGKYDLRTQFTISFFASEGIFLLEEEIVKNYAFLYDMSSFNPEKMEITDIFRFTFVSIFVYNFLMTFKKFPQNEYVFKFIEMELFTYFSEASKAISRFFSSIQKSAQSVRGRL